MANLIKVLLILLMFPISQYSFAGGIPDCPTKAGYDCHKWKEGATDNVCMMDGTKMVCTPLNSSFKVKCHCNPNGAKSSDWPLGTANSNTVNSLCNKCNNDFCRKKTNQSSIKNYKCQY
jgi:hypothetical protein